MDNMSLIYVVEDALEVNLRYNHTGQDLIKEVVKIIHSSKIQITWQWVHSHKRIQYEG